MPAISVIVPVYKVEPYLRPCLDSILAQTFPDFELILVDDGSPDSCGVICDEYAAQDSRIRVIHQENGGLSAARNTGIDAARGEYLSFIDSDDLIHPEMLERLLCALRKTGAELCVCGLLPFSEEASIEQGVDCEQPVQVLDPASACMRLYDPDGVKFTIACGKLYASHLFSSIRFPAGMLHEDEATTYQALYAANRIAELRDSLYFYRKNPSSIMNSAFSAKRFDALIALQNRKLFFDAQGEFALAKKTEQMYRICHARLILLAKNADSMEQIPPQYKMRVSSALRCLRKETPDKKYTFFLAMVYPHRLRLHEYWRKIKKTLHIPCQ